MDKVDIYDFMADKAVDLYLDRKVEFTLEDVVGIYDNDARINIALSEDSQLSASVCKNGIPTSYNNADLLGFAKRSKLSFEEKLINRLITAAIYLAKVNCCAKFCENHMPKEIAKSYLIIAESYLIIAETSAALRGNEVHNG
jgi:hypothetical protein